MLRTARPVRTVLAALVLASACSSALAEIKLSPIFSDHMVIQRGVACPIWGNAEPGAKVEISLEDGKSVASSVANDKGFFRAKLPVLAEGTPHTITVKAGDDTVTLSDVLAGEVWIASGQSNMQWSVSESNNAAEEIKNANHPNIRLFYVPRTTSDEPIETIDAKWQVCSPETIGGFSAVAYFFGRDLNKELNVPIGLIHTSWGGTIAETWTPAKQIEALNVLPGVAKLSTTLKDSKTPEGRERIEKSLKEWYTRKDKLLTEASDTSKDWASADFDDSAWSSVEQPGDTRAIENHNGVGWLRKTVEVPADLAGKDLTLRLARIDDFDVTSFNGERVGDVLPSSGGGFITNRVYTVPGKLVKAGKNVIAIRVLDTGGAAGLGGPSQDMKLEAKDDAGKMISLTGTWKFKLEQALDAADPRPNNPADPGNPNMPSRLYNAMIHPLHDFAIKGAIWYQGESNAERFAEYEKVLSTMIGAWREQFGVGDFSFYQVGLANFHAPTDDPNQPSEWAYLRQAQRDVARNVKNAGMSVTIDIGEEKDIHPKNKQDVGKRLALLALKDTYGKNIVSRGPTLKEAKFESEKVILSFENFGSGLVAKDGLAQSFSLAGEDGKFAWADAKIEGDTVVLSAKDVKNPARVRYAFADNPKATLFNKEGLPAEPFEAKKK
jgi:sialate O-acetylesterase